MNRQEFFIQIPNAQKSPIVFQETYLAQSQYGGDINIGYGPNLVLGLEFRQDLSNLFYLGQIIDLDKFNKSINPWVDGTASVIGITSSFSFGPTGSMIFTDRPLQLPISYTSNESGYIYPVSDVVSEWPQESEYYWEKIDLNDEAVHPVIFNISDIRNLKSRNSSYTLTINFPGTKTNNIIFKNIFDIQSISNYDTRKKVKCNSVYETLPIYEGYLKLNNIICDNNNHWTYQCTIFVENGNFSKDIDENAKLEDLDFTEFNHTFNLNSVTQSWYKDWSSGYYYPVIDLNTGADVDNTPSITSATLSYSKWQLEYFRPSIYVKQYINKIFKNIGYKWESDFFNTPEFENLIIPSNIKDILNDPEWRFNSSFLAGITQSATHSITSLPFQPSFDVIHPATYINVQGQDFTDKLRFNDNSGIFYDPGLNFYQPVGGFYYKNVFEGSVYKDQTITLNLDYTISASSSTGATTSLGYMSGQRILFTCAIYKNGVLIPQPTGYRRILDIYYDGGEVINEDIMSNNYFSTPLFGGSKLEQYSTDMFGGSFSNNFSFRRQTQITLDSKELLLNGIDNNDEIEFRLYAFNIRRLTGTDIPTLATNYVDWSNTTINIEFYPTTNGVDGTYVFNNINPILSTTQPFRLIDSVPRNIKQIDFLSSISKMFNLYFYQDKIDPKKIYIEPRDQFYGTEYIDWSDKLDLNKEIDHHPIVDRKKRVLLTYKEDKDFYNDDYKSRNNEVYGQFEYDTGNEFDNSIEKIDVIFSPTPLSFRQINNNEFDNAYVYSKIIQKEQPIPFDKINKFDANIRILYRKTLTIPRDTKFRISSILNIPGRFGNFAYSVFPYAGHLDDPYNPTIDLNFSEPKTLYYLADNYGYTQNNLYNNYYELFFEEVYGRESKLITAYFYLTSKDIFEFDYRKLIYIERMSSGSPGYFRVNKIEWDPSKKDSYRVELIKVLNDFKFTKRNKKGGIFSKPNLSIYDDLRTIGGNLGTGNINIIGGANNNVISTDTTIVVGNGNVSSNANSAFISGSNNKLTGAYTSILGGYGNISGGDFSSIIGGFSNSVAGNCNTNLNGFNNVIEYNSNNSQILSGCNNTIGLSTGTGSYPSENNSIIGGFNNIVYSGLTDSSTYNNLIIGGSNNIINPGVTNSIILNGSGVTMTMSNAIYVGAGSGTPVRFFINGTEIPQSFTGSGGGTGSVSVDYLQVAFGSTPSGLTSSGTFKYDPVNSNLIESLTSSINTSVNSSIIGGDQNIIGTSSNGSIIGSSGAEIISSTNSTIIGGKCNISEDSIYTSLIGGSNNLTCESNNSAIISGYGNKLYGTGCTLGDSNIIVGGFNNTICSGVTNSVIIGGENITVTQSNTFNIGGNFDWNTNTNNFIASAKTSTLSSSTRSVSIGGEFNTIDNLLNSAVIAGSDNISNYSINSSIISGSDNCLINSSYYSSILGGQNNIINFSSHSTMVGTEDSNITCSGLSSIIGSDRSIINCTSQSSIISGDLNFIYESLNSSTLGGCSNTICGSTNSSIIGGQSLTLTNKSNTILVPNLIVDQNISFNNVSGRATVSGNTVTVNTSYVKSTSVILVTPIAGAVDAWYIDNIVDGVSFDIVALSTGGNGDISWLIIN